MDQDRAERRRLKTLLDDEHYGPALVRLTRSQQRQVLDLVEQNKGREARTLIDRMDRERKDKRTGAPKRKVVAHIVEQLKKEKVTFNVTTIASGVNMMRPAERSETLKMSGAQIRANAGDGNNIRIDVEDIPRNPWWYH